jgi:hypothetical protein
MISAATRGAARPAEAIARSQRLQSQDRPSVRVEHPSPAAQHKISAEAAAELKALHRKGSADGWPPISFLAIAAWHDRNRPDNPAAAHRWRRWGGFEFVPSQQRSAAAMKRAGGAL